MLKLKTHKRFEKDAKLAIKRGKDMYRLWSIIHKLQQGQTLAIQHRPHLLTGDWSPYWECHITPDWLLIYYASPDTLELIRTGTHSDLFG